MPGTATLIKHQSADNNGTYHRIDQRCRVIYYHSNLLPLIGKVIRTGCSSPAVNESRDLDGYSRCHHRTERIKRTIRIACPCSKF